MERDPALEAYIAAIKPAWDEYKAIVKPAWHAYAAATAAADQRYKVIHKAANDACQAKIQMADKIYLVSRDKAAFTESLEQAFVECEKTLREADKARQEASTKAFSLYESAARPAWYIYQTAVEACWEKYLVQSVGREGS